MIHWEDNNNRGDRLVDGLVADHVGRRLRWAVIASIIVNMILWRAASGIAQKSKYKEPPPVEITRVTIDEKNRVVEKKITPQQIKKKVVKIHEEIKRKQPQRIAQKPPEGAHHRVLTAIPDKHGPPPADDHTALSGGNAKVGEAIEKQQPGEAVANPPAPKKEEAPTPPAPKKEEAPPPAPKKEEAPPPPAPKKEEAPPPPAPKKEEPPKPKGPTKDAEPDNQVKPEIPDNLKQGSYKSFVRVKVEIDEDGSFTPILRTSSGNQEIDRRVLESLKRWKWKPALKDGVPVKSTQLFKFEFEVE